MNPFNTPPQNSTAEFDHPWIIQRKRIVGVHLEGKKKLMLGDEVDFSEYSLLLKRYVLIKIHALEDGNEVGLEFRDPIGRIHCISSTQNLTSFVISHSRKHLHSCLMDLDGGQIHVLGDDVIVKRYIYDTHTRQKWIRGNIIEFMTKEDIVLDPAEDLVKIIEERGRIRLVPYEDILENITAQELG